MTIDVIRKMVSRENLNYKDNKYRYNLKDFETMRSFAKSIYDSKTTLDNTIKDQYDFLLKIGGFNKDTKPKILVTKSKKAYS